LACRQDRSLWLHEESASREQRANREGPASTGKVCSGAGRDV